MQYCPDFTAFTCLQYISSIIEYLFCCCFKINFTRNLFPSRCSVFPLLMSCLLITFQVLSVLLSFVYSIFSYLNWTLIISYCDYPRIINANTKKTIEIKAKNNLIKWSFFSFQKRQLFFHFRRFFFDDLILK